jgi:hypothetical protein
MVYIFRTLLIILVIYYAGVLFFRIIFPFLLKWYIKRKLKQKGFDVEGNNTNFNQSNNKQKVGQVNISHIPDNNENKKDDDDNDGEYVDYEEIK